ncbi:MAG: exosortase-associated EpsI family protein [Gemmataceae bacterium]|nr:EpsI family protein [Gemmata sp.]MDW8199427.1 exosortase-associated EpsI family protein [Gemmataceae bacterium]
MPRWLIVMLALGGLAAAAAVEGFFTNRWGPSANLRWAVEKLAKIPGNFGAWSSVEVPLDPKQVKVAEAAGYVSRIYTHRQTGRSFTVLLLCGPPGPIGAHTPEVCYAGMGYNLQGPSQKHVVKLPDNTVASYWSARFEKRNSLDEPPLRVCWMWGVQGQWHASDRPRSEFALHQVLYKLYVVCAETEKSPATTNPMASEPASGFLTEFLPEVKKALAGSDPTN